MHRDFHLTHRSILPIWQNPNKLISTKGDIRIETPTEEELISQMKIQNLLTWVGYLDNSTPEKCAPDFDGKTKDP